MSSSISPPYPKNLQILHDINYIDPTNPLFSKKLDILKKKTSRANNILNEHNSYLETIQNQLNSAKNIYDQTSSQDKISYDNITNKNTSHNSDVIHDTLKNGIKDSTSVYKSLLNFFQKIINNILDCVNGNVGALILAIVGFISFFILLLWIFNVIKFEPKTSSTSTTSSYNIPDPSELIPQPSSGSSDYSFNLDDFFKNENKLEYTTNCINKSFNRELQNSPGYITIAKNYKKLKDGITNTFKSFNIIDDDSIIQELSKTNYTPVDYHFHDELYLPIDGNKQIALFKPKNFTITSQIDPDNENYKFLISNITNYSLNDFSEIKIIFEEYTNENIHNNGCLKIKEIISNKNDKIIFYKSSNSNNIIDVNYITNSVEKIEIKFNENNFNHNIQNIILPLRSS